MATGYDDGGAEDLICVSPPDDGDNVIPSAFAGLIPRQDTGPVHAVGVNDVSIEAWIQRREGSPIPGDPTEPCIGLFESAPGLNRVFTIYSGAAAPVTYAARYRSAGGNIASVPGWPASEMLPGFHHYVANFDRDGDLTTYRDSILTSTTAMPDAGAPTNQGNMYFYPLSTYLLGAVYINMLVGPVAFHLGALLTVAQMTDSVHRRGVQILAETQQAFFWKDIDGATGWDTENITTSIDWRTLDDNNLLAAPEGTTVIARDSSGNGNDWTMPTAAEYSAVSLAEVAFVSDRFWR